MSRAADNSPPATPSSIASELRDGERLRRSDKRLRINLKPYYRRQVAERMASRGIKFDEALHQLLEEARPTDGEQWRNDIMGRLNLAAAEVGKVRLKINRSDLETHGQLKAIAEILNQVSGAIAVRRLA